MVNNVLFKLVNQFCYQSSLCYADVDGSHIKGLLMNLFHTFWPSIIKDLDGFLSSMLTPIIKASKGSEIIAFYTLSEYNEWKSHTNTSGFKIKYFKGLGTSTAAEAKEYFKELKNSQVTYTAGVDLDETIKLAFSKDYSNYRKSWLLGYDSTSIIEQAEKTVTIDSFVNRELIHFSQADIVRSIPALVDGLKPSQRKVLFGCLKRNLVKECKVSQLCGGVAEVSGYHSGEASLQSTIIGMAQDFVGSNGINILSPNGQFGTRLQGGKDAASPRYIFTQLSDITKTIFNENDSPLLTYLDDDGFPIEPKYYAPIIPMVLVNGANGIGTGFSTQVPCYNPLEIVDNIHKLLNDQEVTAMYPWYRGFTGTITNGNGTSYTTHGKYSIDGDTVEITELPIGRWTDDYKEFLENALIDNSEKNAKVKKKMFLSSYENHSTEATVRFIVRFPAGKLAKLKDSPEELESDLRLTTSVGTSNMHLFSTAGAIRKYDSPEEILQSYYVIRLQMYEERRQHMLKVLRHDLSILENKLRFVSEIMDDQIVIYRKAKTEIEKLLLERNYLQLTTSATDDGAGSFNYLTSMQISSFTKEKIESIEAEIQKIKALIDALEKTTDKEMWRSDLEAFKVQYAKLLQQHEETTSMIMDDNKKRPQSLGHKRGNAKKLKQAIVV